MNLITALLFAASVPHFSQAKDVGNLLRLNGEQTDLLEQLKSRVYPKIKEEYMKNDWYFYKFLKDKEWNLDKAELAMLNYIDWRDEFDMPNLEKEDLSELKKAYPYKIDGVDKHGRPVLLVDFEKWNFTDGVSDPEKSRQFFRFFNRMFDEAMRKVMAMQSAGKNVTRFLLLADLDGVSYSKHVNPSTAGYYYKSAEQMQNHFPGMFNDIVYINTPSVFQTLMPLFRFIFSEEMNKGFNTYSGEEEWKSVLDNLIDPSELPPNYGGTKGLFPAKKKEILVGSFFRNKNGQWDWIKGNADD